MILSWSAEPRTSRRVSADMMLSGWGSYARTKTYRLRSSYAALNSVLNRGVFPSVGCCLLYTSDAARRIERCPSRGLGDVYKRQVGMGIVRSNEDVQVAVVVCRPELCLEPRGFSFGGL